MEVFAWNPKAQNEGIDDFNGRLAAFCVDNPVIDITVSTLGPAICLSLTLAEDADIDSAMAIVPKVMVIGDAQMLALEKTVGDELAAITATDSDDAPALPFKVTLHDCMGVSSMHYAVILINAGEIEVDGEDAPEPEPAPRGHR
jgi:hypothetical protein